MKIIKIFLKHLLSFSVIKDILTFYVLLVSILTLLVAVGIFNIETQPVAKILKPVYVYNLNEIEQKFQNDTLKKKTELFPRLRYNLYDNKNWRSTLVGYYYDYNDWNNYSNEHSSYEMYDKIRKIEEYTGYMIPDEWYLWGYVNGSNNLVKILNNSDALRDDDLKIYHLYLLLHKAYRYEADSLKKLDTNIKLAEVNRLSYNPLSDLVMCDSLNFNCSDLIYNISDNMLIYSCVSVCNLSSQTMNNINLTLSDIFRYGRYSLVGWTKTSSISAIVQNPTSIELTIDRLESGRSIEIVFRGSKYIRSSDINLSGSYLSYIDKQKVKSYLIGITIVVLFIYFTFWFLSRKANAKS